MGIWRRLFGEGPAPERLEPGDDQELLQRSLSTLADHGFRPCREITIERLGVDPREGLLAFRRRPLTTLLTLPDASGRPLFGRVFVDTEDLNRVDASDLPLFITAAAEHSGTGDLLRGIRVMCDPGTDRTGSLRYTIGHDVRDHSFDLDPDFGNDAVEAAIVDGVSPADLESFTFYARPSMTPVTPWLDIDSDDHLVEALRAENTEANSPPTG